MINIPRMWARRMQPRRSPYQRSRTIHPDWLVARSGAALIIVIMTAVLPKAGVAQAQASSTPAFARPQGTGASLFLPLIQGSGSAQAVTYDVEYADNTVVVDESTLLQSLLSVSEDQAIYRFQPPADAIRQLQPGQVVLLAGLALRKVVRVSNEGEAIVVETAPAQLDEAIADGTLAWSYTVDWMALPQTSYLATQVGETGSALQLVSAQGFDPATGPPEITFSGEIEGWEVTFKLKASHNRLDLELVAERAIGAAEAVVSAKGWISEFTHTASLSFERFRAGQMAVSADNLHGEMELRWSALTPGAERLTKNAQFALPVELPIPLRVGPVPVMLKLKAVLQIVPELAVAQASSTGSYRIIYDSNQGFRTEGEVVRGRGEVNNVQIGLSGDTGSAGLGPVGFGLGVEFPRLEVEVLGSAMAFITIKTYSASIYLMQPPCQKAITTMFAAAGYRLGILGLTFAEGQKELWREEFVKYKDDHACG